MKELALLFLRLGATAFGGPAAHIAFMEEEVVTKRGWLTRQEFLDLFGATQFIPGPNSTEMALHIGYRRHGFPGLVIAGLCFILPAALIVTALAWAYVRWGSLPELQAAFSGIKPVVLAVIGLALWRLGRTALKNAFLTGVAFTCLLFHQMGQSEILMLFAAAVFCFLFSGNFRNLDRKAALFFSGGSLFLAGEASAATAVAVAPFSLTALFLFFLKTGSVLFGSGYVLLAFLRTDLVERWHWLTPEQLLDAVAVGQFTPGPFFTTATFIGYTLGGGPGAFFATLGIFLPAFFFVAAIGPWVPKPRSSARASAVLDGVNAVSLALMASVTLALGRGIFTDGRAAILFFVSLFLLARFKINSAWLVLAGAVTGWVLR